MTDPVTQAAEVVEVTQADRDAAAVLIEAYWSGADSGMMKLAQSYRAGHSQGVFVRAFARHRLSAELAARSGGWPVAFLYENERGDKELILDCNGEHAARLLASGYTETPLFSAISSMEAPSHG